MKTMICLVVAALLSGCLPIGIKGSTGASAGEPLVVASTEGALAAAGTHPRGKHSRDLVAAGTAGRA